MTETTWVDSLKFVMAACLLVGIVAAIVYRAAHIETPLSECDKRHCARGIPGLHDNARCVCFTNLEEPLP